MKLEYKELTAELKDIDSKTRVVQGYLSKFDNLDLDNDIMERNAFTKTLSERKGKIFFLNQHDWKQPHGLFKSLEVDDYGLKFESNPLPNTSYSNDALELYEKGIVKEHSIGFITIKDEYDTKTGVRKLKEVALYEGSNVTLGANPEAVLTGLKSFTKKDLRDREKAILKAFKNGTFTDETFGLLEIALKELQKYTADLAVKEALMKSQDSTREKSQEQAKEALNLIKNFKL